MAEPLQKADQDPPIAEKTKLHPIDTCSFLSYCTVQWVTPLLRLGANQPLQLADVYDLPESMRAENLGAKFLAAFERKRQQKVKQPIVKALLSAFGRNYLFAFFCSPIHVGCQAMMPLMLKALIRFLNNEAKYKEDPFLGIENGWAIAGCLALISFGTVIGMNSMFLNITMFGVNSRTALMEVLYRKVLRVSEASFQQTGYGFLITLASADLERIFLGALQSLMLATAPPLVIICITLLILEVGVVPTVAGFSIVFLVLPLNIFVSKKMGQRKRDMLQLTDARVRFMSDVLKGIKLVKLYAWEENVEQLIQELRVKEVRENTICVQLMAFSQSTGYALPALIPFFMFITYAAMGNELTMDKVFAILALMNIIRMPMQMIPRAANGVIQALVSLRRIEVFLTIPDRAIGWEALQDTSRAPADAGAADIDLQNVSCCWGGAAERKAMAELVKTAPKKGKGKGKPPAPVDKPDDKAEGKGAKEGKGSGKGEEDKGDGKGDGKGQADGKDNGGATASESTLVLAGVTLVIPRGQKVAVVGRVASGKSSLMYGMLGELEVTTGTVSRSAATVPFCSQSAWIQSSTLKQNILFGLPEDPELYSIALEASQLLPDLQILPDGDLTCIGENGINLSGGQKARTALARAFYTCLKRDAPLVLLDDPLAAVDAFVAHALFHEGFLGLLKKQTIVLTLNAHLDLLSKFDRVICLDGGVISADGSLADVMAVEPWIRDAVGSDKTGDESKVEEAKPEIAMPAEKIKVPALPDAAGPRNSLVSLATPGEKDGNIAKPPRPLYEPEDRVTGRVQWHNYVEWARCAISEDSAGNKSGMCLLGVLGLAFGLCQCLRISLDIFCARWGNEGMELEDAVPVYGALAGGFIVSVFIRAAVFLLIAMRSCRVLHKRVLKKVLMAPLNLFFDVTQSGTILNRFSGDLEKVDDKLPEQLYTFLNLLITVFAALVVCLISSPFVVCGFPILGYAFIKIVSFYQKSARELKRLQSISLSPLLQLFSESIRGLVTIRAYGSAPAFVSKYDDLVNKHSKVFFTVWISSRWLAMRVDSCATALQSFVALVSIAWKDNIDPVMVGIALVWGFQLSGLLQFCVRSFAEVENTMTGVERLVAYKYVPQEAAHIQEPRPAKTWPKGEIELRNVSARYRPNLPLVLRNVSLHIRPGERVGICGRTGSGKSSLLLILFRIVEVDSGQVFIDGQDTRTIGLRDLRQRIAIIPQDPILFRMPVRQNMDPFGMYTDAQIWKALELVCMDKAVRALEGDLSFLCAEGGTNFSLGEMQLLCIARALLREPGVVMMDEATANVDAASDEIIQTTIRSQFKNSTVLTIAHRLSTIADSMKIAVLEQGEVAEFGTPKDLVQQGGALQAFFSEAGIEVPSAPEIKIMSI